MMLPNYTGHRKDPEMLENYFQIFRKMKVYPTRICEIGVDNGGSLYLLNDLFNPNLLLGIDHKYPNTDFFQHNNRLHIDFILADQADMKMEEIEPYAPFDLIIEDASHNRDLSIKTLHDFWPLLDDYGTYIVEDWPATDMGNFYDMADNIAQGLKADLIKLSNLIAFQK